jgi:hypothetical protein
MTFENVKGAAAWASYFINGDASGLDPAEVTQADAWLERNNVAEVVDVGEPFFSWLFGFHVGSDCLGGELVEYTVRVAK